MLFMDPNGRPENENRRLRRTRRRGIAFQENGRNLRMDGLASQLFTEQKRDSLGERWMPAEASPWKRRFSA
jgi:hypothetical protein